MERGREGWKGREERKKKEKGGRRESGRKGGTKGGREGGHNCIRIQSLWIIQISVLSN